MKKENIAIIILGIIVLAFIAILFLFPNNKTETVKTVNTPVLKKESAKDIKFDKEKINIYLFWGDGCPHCEELFAFLTSIQKEYGKYYNLYTLEVWNDEENNALMQSLADKLGEPTTGVPYLIIGNEVFVGYIEEDQSQIKAAIKKEYEKETHYDVYKEYQQSETSEKTE